MGYCFVLVHRFTFAFFSDRELPSVLIFDLFRTKFPIVLDIFLKSGVNEVDVSADD
jgi:hypothetical protein